MDSSDKISMCRLCLRTGLSLIDIFAENNEQKYRFKEAIEDLLHFKVQKRLGLPWVICPICCVKLDDFWNFKSQSLNSNEKFERKLSQQEELFEESPSPVMVDLVEMKIEPSEIQEEICPQVARVSPIQNEQEEEMMSDRVSMEMDSLPSSERGIAGPHLINEGCAADFWRGTEAALKITVPKYLKNILKLNGCDNGLSMADFDAATLVPVLERFVREDMPYILPLHCSMGDYYGMFERCPERFRIVWGHVNILTKMTEYWKEARRFCQVFQRKNECSFTNDLRFNPQLVETQVNTSVLERVNAEDQNKTTPVQDTTSVWQDSKMLPQLTVCPHSTKEQCNQFTAKTMVKSGESSGTGVEKSNAEALEAGLSHWRRERNHLIEVIKESLRDKTVEYSQDMNVAINNLQASDVVTKFRLIADVQCFLCMISIRAYKVCNDFSVSKWMVSNYVRHVVEQHCLGSKKNKKKSASPTETGLNTSFDWSRQDSQQSTGTRENALGDSALEDYGEEDAQTRVGSFYDETPSKKKRSVRCKSGSNSEV